MQIKERIIGNITIRIFFKLVFFIDLSPLKE